MSFNFEKLDVYQKAADFVDDVYAVTRSYPKEETFGLTNQFRKAAVSIVLNIAEGSARSKRDFSRFLDMARGSVLECMAVLRISGRLGYVDHAGAGRLEEQLTEISKMLSGLKRSLRVNTTNSEPRTMNVGSSK
ncbi:MAG: four helix bundle protein [Planctomycetota bacterium]|jgi:four helix bundle protein